MLFKRANMLTNVCAIKKNTFWCYFITLIALKTKNTIWAQNFSELWFKFEHRFYLRKSDLMFVILVKEKKNHALAKNI